jgi:hypothetical protein
MFELRLENSNGSIVDLNDGERYEVISVSGLHPPSASLFTSKSPNKKGLKHNGSTLNERVVVIQIKLHGDIEVSRNALYEWVEPEQYCKIYYRNGVKNVYCEGYVQDCPIDIFTDNEIVNVEILCGDPYLKDFQEIVINISHLQDAFTFPFAISHERRIEVASKNPDGSDAVVYYNEGIPFSTFKESNVTSVYNAGAETGVQFAIRCTEPITSLVIFDADNTARQFKIEYADGFREGWQIIIDTEGSPKTCKAIKPDGTVLNILRYVKGNPTWFELKKGNNSFGYTANNGSATATVAMTVTFTNKYMGV